MPEISKQEALEYAGRELLVERNPLIKKWERDEKCCGTITFKRGCEYIELEKWTLPTLIIK